MLHINLDNLTKNVKELTSGERKLIGVVKNNAYGCGIVQISRHLISLGVDFLLINDINEIKPLLDDGIKIKILVHNSVTESAFSLLKEYPNIIVTVNNIEDAKRLSKSFNNELTVHIQIDTGMNRLGIKTIEDFNEVINILKNSKINIEGIYTHFASPNSMKKQLQKFKTFSEKYNFNREINDKRISREKIILPINKNKKPDFEYMEQYIKNLIINKYDEYLEYNR